jgi:nucleotide-binding universal stress UspA family protein
MLQLDPGLHERLEKRMKRLVGSKLRGLDVRYVVGEGKAAKLIKNFAQDEDIDLVIMASAGANGIGDFLFGSTASRVIQRAVCPVLIV